MDFELVSEITDVETTATGIGVRASCAKESFGRGKRTLGAHWAAAGRSAGRAAARA
jgi:hypothetical protein